MRDARRLAAFGFAAYSVAGALVAMIAPAQATPLFLGLGRGTNLSGSGDAIAPGGGVVAGTLGPRAFRWSLATGTVDLGDLDDLGSEGLGASGDGSVIVGRSRRASGTEAFRWTAAGMEGLGDLDGGLFDSTAHGVSADGKVIVGQGAAITGSEAFRWTADTGMVALGDLAAGRGSLAVAADADGSVVVGDASGQAFRWTEATGLVGLGSGGARGVSPDGQVIVGFRRVPGVSLEAMRWTQETGMVGLGDFAGGSFSSFATGVSADGSVVVGAGTTDSGQTAFVWDSTHGMRSVLDVLVGSGLDLTGWILTSAMGISADGLVLAGTGINPQGSLEAWVATLEQDVPEPAGLGLVGLGLAGLGLVRSTKRKRA